VDHVRALRTQWRVVLACVAAALAVGAVLVSRASPVYRATVTMFIAANHNAANPNQAYVGNLFVQERMKSYAELASSPLLVQRVADELGPAVSAADVQARIAASSKPDTVLLTVSVVDESPERAQRIASAVGKQFAILATDVERSPAGNTPVRIAVAQDARLPRHPIAPHPADDLALAGLLGLVLGSGSVLVRARLDTAVSSPEEVREVTGAPVLGSVPYDRSVRKGPAVAADSSPRDTPRDEAYRSLRTNLDFVGGGTRPRSLVVTGSVPDEGRATTACNLAATAARGGLRVLLVECDLRRPRIAALLGAPASLGLTDVLTGHAPRELVVRTALDGLFDVLGAGTPPPNPSELLGSRAMRRFVADAETAYDLVILNAAPLLTATDAALVAAASGGALLVVRHDRTTREQLATATRALASVGATLLGSVMTMAPGRRSRYYGSYRATTPADPAARPSFLGQTLGTTFSQAAFIVLSAGSSVMAARFLGASGRGALAAASLGPGLAVSILGLGQEISNVYFVGRGKVRPETAFGTSAVLAAWLSALGIGGYLSVAAMVRDSVLGDISWPLILVGSALVPVLLLTRYSVGVAQGLRRIALINLSSIAGAAATVVLYAVLLGVFHGGPLAGLVAIVAGSTATTYVLVRALWKAMPRPSWDREYLRRALRFGVRGHIGNVVTMLTYRIDVFVVTAFLGLAAAGRYAVAYTTTELLWQIPNAIAMILFPRIAAAGEEGAAITARLCRLSLAGTMLLAVGVAVAAPRGIPFVFSTEFRDAVPALIWLLPGIVLFAGGKLLSSYLTGRGRPDLPSKAALLTLPTVLGLDLVLIRPFGIVGAAVASSIAYCVGALVLARMFVRHSGLPWSSLWRPTRADVVLVAAAAREVASRRRRPEPAG
jgi:non-specific protein-tyrosine kinase